MLLKGCPRCRGDIHVSWDVYGRYWDCLQCGYMLAIDDPNKLLESPNTFVVKKLAQSV